MRVLMLTTDLELGGVERTIINRVHCLREVGLECAVAGLRGAKDGSGVAGRRLAEAGFPVFCARIERPLDGWRFVGLRRFVGRWAPDVVHAHMFHGHLAGALLRLCGWRGKMLWSHHSVAPRRRPLRSAFYRLFSPLASAHVFVSESVRAYQQRMAGVAPREQIIYNGIDLEPFLAVRPKSGPVFGAVGRLVPLHKGFDLLIRAFARLCEENARVRLEIAGDGPERSALEELARRAGVSERVKFHGFVEDVPGFLGGINVFVNPSRWEAFGNTLVEGLAAGLPCIASRIHGLPEIGEDMVRWVRAGDVEDLYGAMRESVGLRYSPARRARQRRRVAARFSRERMVEEYLDLYTSLVRPVAR